MKAYTTQVNSITLDGGEPIITAAEAIVVTVKGRNRIKDYVPEIVTRTEEATDGTTKYIRDTLQWTMDQEDTAAFQGTSLVEATIRAKDGSVAKSETFELVIKPSVRKGEF